jgi:hypothetical protein
MNVPIGVKTAVCALICSIVAAAQPRVASSQTLPSGPIVLADGRMAIGGDVSVSIAPNDPGFFNYTDYEHSVLRMLRLDVAASFKAGEHFSVLGEMRSENLETPHPYALYVRIRPWAKRALDIQVGRIPPTFGAFTRRIYPSDNPLIGYPLAFQYLTSLRPDALPANADELLQMRGRGWLSSYSIGNLTPDRGLPLATAFTWDTGVQVHAASRVLEATASITAGTVSNPLFHDDNTGRQLAGRLVWRPTPGLILGASAAHGPFITEDAARRAVGDGRDGEFTQTAWGGDVEYSRAHYLVRAEGIFSRWVVPAVAAPLIDQPLRAMATYVEGRYKIRPRLYAAGRIDYLGFSAITGTLGRETWEAPVTRFEVGGGYSVQRNLLVKGSYQHNSRSAGRTTMINLGAAQIVYWF